MCRCRVLSGDLLLSRNTHNTPRSLKCNPLQTAIWDTLMQGMSSDSARERRGVIGDARAFSLLTYHSGPVATLQFLVSLLGLIFRLL